VDARERPERGPWSLARERLASLQAALDAQAQQLGRSTEDSAVAEATAPLPVATLVPADGAAVRGAGPVSAVPPEARRAGRAPWQRGWRGLAAGLVLAECLVLGLLLARTSQAPAGVYVLAREPTLVRLQGDAALWRQTAPDPAAVAGAVTLVPNDRVQTGPAGRAAITWPQGATATLDPDSGAVLLPAATDGVTRVQLAGGGLWLDSGPHPSAAALELLTPEGARVSGRRFQAHRDGNGRLMVATADAPAVVVAGDGRQEVAPGGTTEVLPGRRPALPRPAVVPSAVAVSVEGPAAWLLVDRYGRAVGAPPDGAPWVGQIPAARGPMAQARGSGVVLPDPHGEYQVLLWAGEASRPYRVAVWTADGQALFGGPAPGEAPGALRLEGEAQAGSRVALTFAVQDRTIAAVGRARAVAGLPDWLRLAIPAAPPRDAPGVASQQPPGPVGAAALPGEPAVSSSAVAANPSAAGTAPAASAGAVPAAPPSSAVGDQTAAPASPDTVYGTPGTPDDPPAGDTVAGAAPAEGEPQAAPAAPEPSGPTFGYSVAGIARPASPTSTPVVAASLTPAPVSMPRPAPTLERIVAPLLSENGIIERDSGLSNAPLASGVLPGGATAPSNLSLGTTGAPGLSGAALSTGAPLVTSGATAPGSLASGPSVGTSPPSSAGRAAPSGSLASGSPAGGTAGSAPSAVAPSGSIPPGGLASNTIPPGNLASNTIPPGGLSSNTIPPGSLPSSSVPPGGLAASPLPGGLAGTVAPGVLDTSDLPRAPLTSPAAAGSLPGAAGAAAPLGASTAGSAAGAAPAMAAPSSSTGGIGTAPPPANLVHPPPGSLLSASSVGGAALQGSSTSSATLSNASDSRPPAASVLSGTPLPARATTSDSSARAAATATPRARPR
jgi:hypothetical protein